MYLKITTPQEVLFEWNINKVSIPTENWTITILPNHMPLVSIVVPWIITVWSDNLPKENKRFAYLFEWKWLALSISKWFVYIDWQNINIVSTEVTNTTDKTTEELVHAKQLIQQDIDKLREQWAIEEVEKKLIELKKIDADLQLQEMKK